MCIFFTGYYNYKPYIPENSQAFGHSNGTCWTCEGKDSEKLSIRFIHGHDSTSRGLITLDIQSQLAEEVWLDPKNIYLSKTPFTSEGTVYDWMFLASSNLTSKSHSLRSDWNSPTHPDPQIPHGIAFLAHNPRSDETWAQQQNFQPNRCRNPTKQGVASKQAVTSTTENHSAGLVDWVDSK